jgi:hypothetical protein
LTWIVFVPGNGYEGYDTEAGALDAFQRAAEDLHADAAHDGWPEGTECLAIYEAHPLRTFELEVTAMPDDDTEDGERCRDGKWDFYAEGRVAKHASTAEYIKALENEVEKLRAERAHLRGVVHECRVAARFPELPGAWDAVRNATCEVFGEYK